MAKSRTFTTSKINLRLWTSGTRVVLNARLAFADVSTPGQLLRVAIDCWPRQIRWNMNVQENKQLSHSAEKLSDYYFSALPCFLTIVAKHGPGDLQRRTAFVFCDLIAAMNEVHCLFARKLKFVRGKVRGWRKHSAFFNHTFPLS